MDHMKPGSSIINTSSVNAYTPMPDVRPLLTSLCTEPHAASSHMFQHRQDVPTMLQIVLMMSRRCCCV